MQIKVFYSLVEALNLIVVPKSLPVKVSNSADNLTIESHLSSERKAWHGTMDFYNVYRSLQKKKIIIKLPEHHHMKLLFAHCP